jgi:hypothetical protein
MRIKLLALATLALALSPLARAAGGTCPGTSTYLAAAEAFSLTTLAANGITSCFFISAAGSDSNNGTSEATPWAHLPGMPTCTATCASTVPAAGEGFIFRGGDTWTTANFGVTWVWSGTVANPIYIGVDQSWFSGSAWARPIWNLQLTDGFSGSCTGTVTASLTTGGLYGAGFSTTSSVCSTIGNTPNAGVPMDHAGNMKYLQVTAGTAGTNASSGVFTVYKNGSSTALTCTLGTTTGCSDYTHTVAYVNGDIVTIEYTSQAADTLANLKANVDIGF